MHDLFINFHVVRNGCLDRLYSLKVANSSLSLNIGTSAYVNEICKCYDINI